MDFIIIMFGTFDNESALYFVELCLFNENLIE